MASNPYVLSATLEGHDSDVRAVLSPHPEELYTASRDMTVRRWTKAADQASDPHFVYETSAVFLGHTKYVSSLAYVPGSEPYPKGLIISGSNDATIKVFDGAGIPHEINSPIFTLTGHTDNVCCLNVAPNGDLVTGSWDCSAKVWRNWKCVATLVGHKYAVWAVQGLSDGTVLTASADRLIKRWRGDQCIQTYQGHEDAVRGIVLLPPTSTLGSETFATCSNDGTLRVWALSGSCLRVFHGHNSFVYSISCLSTGELVSSGEDRSIRIWSPDGTCTQTIVLPAQSIWSVDASPNDDIVAGTSNKEAHVFTRDRARAAPAAVRQAYEQLVANFVMTKNATKTVSDQKLSDPQVLLRAGSKDQQVVMVKGDSGTVAAHQWDQSQQQWLKVGTVVDAIDENRKQLFEGKEYDFVFTVDAQEGQPPLKLPYNRDENPYDAAQRFLDRHMLPQSYLDQVVQFITTNAGVAASPSSGSGYQDPFTGASRYMPRSVSTAEIADPTGDPFTGQSRYVPSTGTSAPPASSPLPSFNAPTTPMIMRQGNVATVVAKLKQFDTEVREATPALALTDDQMAHIQALQRHLEANLASTSKAPAACPGEWYEVLEYAASQWPLAHRFPALDLLRLLLCVASPPARDASSTLLETVGRSAHLTGDITQADAKPHLVQLMLAIRVFVNLFSSTLGTQLVWNHKDRIMDDVIRQWSQLVPLAGILGASLTTCRLALVTLLLNLAITLCQHNDGNSQSNGYGTQILTWTLEVLAPMGTTSTALSPQEQELCHRGLVTVGTLFDYDRSMVQVAKLFDVEALVQSLASKNAPQVSRTAQSLQRIFGL
ncbi:WD repeat protein Lub1 [Dimargaris verticillata]|uniref:WD repeat protein Lub1 n=1 Tax=Dimargaris verticillata TaxID=2761393 RepID=A0A9W8E9M2_9FUNG|nr:WD repeat protein Lub1 [Dimargaris verticillata]